MSLGTAIIGGITTIIKVISSLSVSQALSLGAVVAGAGIAIYNHFRHAKNMKKSTKTPHNVVERVMNGEPCQNPEDITDAEWNSMTPKEQEDFIMASLAPMREAVVADLDRRKKKNIRKKHKHPYSWYKARDMRRNEMDRKREEMHNKPHIFDPQVDSPYIEDIRQCERDYAKYCKKHGLPYTDDGEGEIDDEMFRPICDPDFSI